MRVTSSILSSMKEDMFVFFQASVVRKSSLDNYTGLQSMADDDDDTIKGSIGIGTT